MRPLSSRSGPHGHLASKAALWCPRFCLGSSVPPPSLAPQAYSRVRFIGLEARLWGGGLCDHLTHYPQFHSIRETRAQALKAHCQLCSGWTALLTSGQQPPRPLEGWVAQSAHGARYQVHCPVLTSVRPGGDCAQLGSGERVTCDFIPIVHIPQTLGQELA